MVTLLLIGYLGCVMAAFKILRIRVNPTSIATSVLGGVFLIGGVVIAWNFAAPITGQMTVARRTIPLVSGVNSAELITKVYVDAQQLVKKGAPLYEVDQRRNQFALDSLNAQRAVAKETIAEQQAGIKVAAASVEAAKAGLDYARAQLDTAEGIQKDNPAAIAALKVTVQQNKYTSSEAAVNQALAVRKQAEFALDSAQGKLKATEAQIETATLNLAQCVIKAPADGYVMNWQAVEGTMTTTMITSGQGVFMDMSETFVGAVLPQNLVRNIAPGDTAEIAFKSTPGQIATGKVDQILEFTGEGQLQPSVLLPVVADLGSKGYLVVRIKLDDEDLAKRLPLGGAGSTAIYTSFGTPFQVISKIAIRIQAWTNYAF